MVRLWVHGIAKGGDGVARGDDGRVVFVRGALPGDTVDARVVEERKRFARAELDSVVEAGPGRVVPACRHVVEGCGGCDLQHAALHRQRELKVQIVAEALERLGRFSSVPVVYGGGVPGVGYRTNARCGVMDGRAAFRRFHTNDLLAVPECVIVHDAVREVIEHGRFGSAEEMTVMVGARTGERIVVVSPDAEGVEVPASRVVGADELDRGAPAFVHEEAAGRRWRISARSFFQSSPEAADLLVTTVGGLIDASNGSVLCDLYAGVGLFAGGLHHPGPVIAVEGSGAAVADAQHNLSDVDARVVHTSVTGWTPEPADVVVADPSRRGLTASGVETVVGTGAPTVVLVSCDPASFARDARLLVDAGCRLEGATVIDLFPQTSHVEVVARFER